MLLSKDNLWEYEFVSLSPDNTTVKLGYYIGSSDKVIIPETVDGYRVSSVSSGLFNTIEPGTLKEVIMESKISKIPAGFCAHEGELKSFIYPDTVKEIGNRAFLNCFKLSDFEIHDNISVIGDDAFANCKSWNADIVIPNSVIYIGTGLFSFSGIKSATIRANMKALSEMTLYHCPNLKYIDITGSDITILYCEAIKGCPSLTNIYGLEQITMFSPDFICDCKQIQNLRFGNHFLSMLTPKKSILQNDVTLTCYFDSPAYKLNKQLGNPIKMIPFGKSKLREIVHRDRGDDDAR